MNPILFERKIMKRSFILVGVALSLLFNACESGGPVVPRYERNMNYRDVDVQSAEQWSKSVNAFSQSLENAMIKDESYVISPFSIYSALSMIEYGANGDTLVQMSNVLNMGADRDKAAQLNADLIYNLKLDGQNENSKLYLANQIWAEKTLPIVEDFVSTMETVYEAPVMQVDFKNDASGATDAINDWANAMTEGTIPNAIDKNSLSELTKVVLVNAIYFKAKWHYEFDKADTANKTFYNLDGSTHEIPMMSQETELKYYYQNDAFSAVVLPYKDLKFEMIVVLPKQKDGIHDISVSADDISNILNAETYDVSLTMPKFKIESSFSDKYLVERLGNLGMINAFVMDENSENAADFSNMTSSYVYVSKVLQKAMIEVDEEGTTAAAVTAVESCWGCDSASTSFSFVADHPFKYYIVHHDSGAVLFSGESLIRDGEFQLDSAIVPAVAAKKVKRESKVAGKANVVIWPDLNVGNIAVKLIQQFGHANAYGPMLQGFNKVVCDCSRGAPVSEIKGNVVISAVRAAGSKK